MGEFRQARWVEPLVFEISRESKRGHRFPRMNGLLKAALREALKDMPENLRREKRIDLPCLSEVDVVRHFTRLSQMSFGVDTGLYPLGSCTMKYNP